jgi:hypothetical protein
MQRYETHIEQVHIAGGNRLPQSDFVTLVDPGALFSPEARKGRLLIFVEPGPQVAASPAALQLVARTIRKVFYDDDTFSVTSALRTAIRAANKALYQSNVTLSPTQRVTLGLTCAVIRDNELYVAQVAPTQAFVYAEDRLRGLPVPATWNVAHSNAASFINARGLGATLFVEADFYRSPLRIGDGLLLVTSKLAPLLDRASVEALLRGEAQRGRERIAELFVEHAITDGNSVLVQAIPALSVAAQRAPFSPNGVRERWRLLSHSTRDWFGVISGEAALALRRPANRATTEEAAPRPDPLTTMPVQPTHSPKPPAKPRPIELGEGLDQRYARERATRRREPVELPPSAFLGEDSYVPPPSAPRRIDLSDTPALEASARPYRARYELRPLVDMSLAERLMLPFNRLGNAADSALRRREIRRTSPPPAPRVRPQGLSYRKQQPPFNWLLLLGLSLVVIVLIFYGTTLMSENDEQRALEYFSAAESRIAAVRNANDDAAAIEGLEFAREAIEEVRATPAVTETNAALWLRYQTLQREYERMLAAVQRLTYFDTPEVLTTHPAPTGRFDSVVVPPATSSITDPLTLDGYRYIYALDSDTANARLYRFLRDGGTAEAYLSPNQAVQTTVTGPLRATTWREDQVVAIDQGPGGFGYYFRNGGDWNYSKLGDSEIWSIGDRLDMETYDGNLYVWGAAADEILKYSTGRYGDSPDFWINPAATESRDLSTVIDMAVDGDIYLLQSNGRILIYSRGSFVSELTPGDLTPAITAVRSFYVTGEGPDNGWIFILDSLNERVIQLNKQSGDVIQQIKVRPDDSVRLNELTAIQVDDSSSKPIIYLVNGGQILRAAMPAPPRPFRELTQPTATP